MAFKIISIATLTVFYGCYFAKMPRQKMRGIRTDQLGRDKAGFAKFVEITVKAAAVLAAVAEIISIFIGTSRCPADVRIFGAAMGVMGTILFIAAVRTMRDNWRAGVPETDKTELVTNGIFQISRNPAFLGFDLLDIGVLLMFFNPILCALTVFAVVMYHLQIVCVEEKFLLSAFGDGYMQYKKKVCRYFGRKG